jgi:hypothetical protein
LEKLVLYIQACNYSGNRPSKAFGESGANIVMYGVYWLAIKFVLWLLQQNLNTLSQEMVKRGVVAHHDDDE